MNKVVLFLLVLLLIPVAFANDGGVRGSERELERAVEDLSLRDPVVEQTKVIEKYINQDMLSIDYAYVVGLGTTEVHGMMPDQSVRVDIIPSKDLLLEFFVSNIFPHDNAPFYVAIHDLRISVKSLDPSVTLNHAWSEESLYDTTFKAVGINNYLNLPSGSYPIEVIATGRDVTRQVHAAREVFYINIGVPGNSTGATVRRAEIIETQKQNTRILFGVVGVVILVLFGVSLLLYKKIKGDEDDEYNG